jgi:hypothetical protein
VSQDPVFRNVGNPVLEALSGLSISVYLSDPQSLNSYSYARNNPLKYSDPTGNFITWNDTKEFFLGAANSIGSNNIGGYGRNESDNRYYQYGQTVGDIFSLVQGSYEAASGIVITVGGIVGGAISSPTGVGVAVGGGLSVLGASVTAHGTGTAVSATYNLINGLGGGSVAAGNNNWADPNKLQDHFDRHGPDFRAIDADDYAYKAQAFRNEAREKGYLMKNDNGTILIYDPQGNRFGVYNANGKTQTYYKPDPSIHKQPTNMDYWNSQRGVTIR